MKMVRNKILLRQTESAGKSKGGIVLTETHKLPYGTVVDVGPELTGEHDVIVGQVVLFNPITLVELGTLKEGHILIEPDDILAILEEGDY